MPDILQTLRAAYTKNPAAALNMLPELFKQYDEGLIKAMPCKVGDTVFKIFEKNVISCIIDGITISNLHEMYFFTEPKSYETYETVEPFVTKEIGKTVFLTRPEAEKALEAKKK
jgi:hypothetical protein